MVEPDPPVKIKRSDQGDLQLPADAELAQLLHQEELAKFFERRKKQLAAERAEAIKNKPPTKTQLRNLMMTYLKNMGGYKHSQLKGKSYEEIQGLYKRQQKRIQDFTPMDSEKEAQKPAKRLKRVIGSYATQKSPKKPKVMKSAKDVTKEEAAEYKKEKQELRLSLKIISNDDSKVDYELLSRKFSIMNWEYQLLGKMEAKDMLVQERFQDHPLEGHDFCEVHTLFMDGTPMEINMLVEKRYPLIKEMLEKKLEAKAESTMAFELLKFIKSQLED
ncbi:hypothetical protein Tco_0618666 [Tanacetum coccineum]